MQDDAGVVVAEAEMEVDTEKGGRKSPAPLLYIPFHKQPGMSSFKENAQPLRSQL
jgi:hypothetical protein